MALSDLWTSPDSQTGLRWGESAPTGNWWQTGNDAGAGIQSVPGAFYSPITRQGYMGLPEALPNQTRTGTMDQAQQFNAGGVDRGIAQYDPDDRARLWGGTSYTANPYQGSSVDPALQAQILAGDRGAINHGLSAFIGGLNQNTLFNGNYNSEGQQHESDRAEQAGQWQNIANLALGLGIDPRSYGSKEAMYNDLQRRTNDYYTVGGLTQATAGRGGGDLAQRTMYRFNPETGTLDATGRPVNYVSRNDDKAFIGRDSLTALSMALPMFGGWAGMLGQGAAGTLSAGSGLGWTGGLTSTIGTGATNALVNAGMSTLMNGGDYRSGLGSLFGAGIGAGLQGNLGNLFQNTGDIGARINPMAYYQQALRGAGLGGSPLGQSQQLLGGVRNLANLFRS